ncbi:hypothetical protein LXL04_022933 [Taraxacum kok-saghyz]
MEELRYAPVVANELLEGLDLLAKMFEYEPSNRTSAIKTMTKCMISADVKKQTVLFLQTADVWSTSSAAEGCRCGPQTADVLTSKKQTTPRRFIVCGLRKNKHLRRAYVCASSARRRQKWSEVLLTEKQTPPLVLGIWHLGNLVNNYKDYCRFADTLFDPSRSIGNEFIGEGLPNVGLRFSAIGDFGFGASFLRNSRGKEREKVKTRPPRVDLLCIYC